MVSHKNGWRRHNWKEDVKKNSADVSPGQEAQDHPNSSIPTISSAQPRFMIRGKPQPLHAQPLEVNLDVSEELLSSKEKLKTCLVGKVVDGAASEREVEEALSALWGRGFWEWNVRAMDDSTFLISLPPSMVAEAAAKIETLSLGAPRLETRGWSPELGAVSRLEKKCVWLNLRQVPVHVWSPFYFSQMVSSFGRLVDIDCDTVSRANLRVARVKVDVGDGKTVPNVLKIFVQGYSYLISISQEPSVEEEEKEEIINDDASQSSLLNDPSVQKYPRRKRNRHRKKAGESSAVPPPKAVLKPDQPSGRMAYGAREWQVKGKAVAESDHPSASAPQLEMDAVVAEAVEGCKSFELDQVKRMKFCGFEEAANAASSSGSNEPVLISDDGHISVSIHMESAMHIESDITQEAKSDKTVVTDSVFGCSNSTLAIEGCSSSQPESIYQQSDALACEVQMSTSKISPSDPKECVSLVEDQMSLELGKILFRDAKKKKKIVYADTESSQVSKDQKILDDGQCHPSKSDCVSDVLDGYGIEFPDEEKEKFVITCVSNDHSLDQPSPLTKTSDKCGSSETNDTEILDDERGKKNLIISTSDDCEGPKQFQDHHTEAFYFVEAEHDLLPSSSSKMSTLPNCSTRSLDIITSGLTCDPTFPSKEKQGGCIPAKNAVAELLPPMPMGPQEPLLPGYGLITAPDESLSCNSEGSTERFHLLGASYQSLSELGPKLTRTLSCPVNSFDGDDGPPTPTLLTPAGPPLDHCEILYRLNAGHREAGTMSDTVEHAPAVEAINQQIHEYREDSSSSSDSDDDRATAGFTLKKKKHLFGREEPVHAVLGGGKSADIILWRNKQMSASILTSGTVIWLLFEWMGYHLLTLVCHSLIFALAVLFLWSNAAVFINKSPPKLPEVILPEDMFLDIARTVRYEINEAFATFRYVASGKDLKQFLMVIAGFWVLSVVGGWFNFLTLCYIIFVTLYTVPVLYEKYEDHVDAAAEKALIQVNKHYEVLDAKVLQKIPKASFMNKKEQ